MSILDDFKRIYRKYLYVKDDSFIDVFFGVIFANRLDAKPIWLYLIGPASSGKTELMMSVDGCSEIYYTSKIKPMALKSGYHKGKEALLPKLNNKILIIKDFTAMLNMRYEILTEVLGDLRDAWDGKSSTSTGIGEIGFKSKFGVIASVTDAIDRHLGLVSDLGERFVCCRMPHLTPYEESKMAEKAGKRESEEDKEREIAAAGKRVLSMNPRAASISDSDRRKIFKVAQFVALARCHIHRDRFSKEPEVPSPEAPVRLPTQLANLAIGIAMVRGKANVTNEEVNLARKIGLDSIPKKRMILFESLLTFYPEYASIKEIDDRMSFDFGETTIRRWLEDLTLLRIVESEKIVNPKGGLVKRWKLVNGELLEDILGD